MQDILETPLKMALKFISNVSPEVRKMQINDIEKGKANAEIQYIDCPDVVKSPYTSFGTVFLPKSFLILLWATCYFLFRITEEIMDLEIQNKWLFSLSLVIRKLEQYRGQFPAPDLLHRDCFLAWNNQ